MINPIISVIVCTHNRAKYLTNTIQSLIDQNTPKDKYEVIVVDNLSTDSTKDIVYKFSNLSNISYFYESKLGLAYARNTGWRNAKGKYVAYLDDDAVAGEGWMDRIIEIFENTRPKPACVGGLVHPIWENPRPSWLTGWLLHCLSIIDWSDKPHFITNHKEEWLVGTNFAFQKEILKKVGGFIIGLDRKGKNLLSNGDLYIQRQVSKAGYSCFYHPEIVAFHHIFPSRLNKKWFIHRYFWQGVSDAAIDIIDNSPSTMNKIHLAFANSIGLVKSSRNLINMMISRDYNQKFKGVCLMSIRVGYIAGLLGAVRN